MGQKVNPLALRLGTQTVSTNSVTLPWSSNWFTNNLSNNYSNLLVDDFLIKNYIIKIYQNLGFSVSNLIIKREYSKIKIEMILMKINSSKKIKKNYRHLKKNKLICVFHTFLKERKFQQRQFLLTYKIQKTSNISDQNKLKNISLTLKNQKNWIDKIYIDLRQKKKLSQKVKKQINYKLDKQNSQIFQHLKRKENQVELKILPEIRQTIQSFLKPRIQIQLSNKQKIFSKNFFLNSGFTHINKGGHSFLYHLNSRDYSKNHNKLQLLKYNHFQKLLPLYFTILKTPSLNSYIDKNHFKSKIFFNQTLTLSNTFNLPKYLPYHDDERLTLPHNDLTLKTSKKFSWNKSFNLKNYSLFFKENLTSQILADFITLELTKSRHARHNIFKGSLKQTFNQIWLNYKYLQEKKGKKIPIGFKIQCKGRWEGKDRKGIIVYETGTVPLSTLQTPVDYGVARFTNKYGSSNIKIWIAWDLNSNSFEKPINPFTQHFQKRRLKFCSLFF